MAQAILELYNPIGDTVDESYKIYFESATIGTKAIIVAKPPLDRGISDVQKHTFENPTYILKNVVLNQDTGTLTYEKMWEFFKKTNPDSDGKYLRLQLDYGTSASDILPDFNGNTDGIKVVLTMPALTLNQWKDDSGTRYVFSGTLTFMETN